MEDNKFIKYESIITVFIEILNKYEGNQLKLTGNNERRRFFYLQELIRDLIVRQYFLESILDLFEEFLNNNISSKEFSEKIIKLYQESYHFYKESEDNLILMCKCRLHNKYKGISYNLGDLSSFCHSYLNPNQYDGSVISSDQFFFVIEEEFFENWDL